MKFFRPWMFVVGGIMLALTLGVFSIYNMFNTIQMEGVDRETALTAQYLDNQNELSSYVSGFYEQIGVANLKSDKMDQILLDAVKGRYDGHTSAQPGQGQLFSAISEAYPDLAGLNIYDKIVDYVKAGRESYKQKQSKLLGMLQQYDKWRESGIIQSRLIKLAGFPSHALRAQIGTSASFGEAALNQMYVIVLTSDTIKAYQTGVQDPLPVPGGKK